jgi:hypothetical protein
MDMLLDEAAEGLANKPKKVAIIGEGPIGLCLAAYLLHLKKSGFPYEIVMFRNRATYSRSHILNISTEILYVINYLLACDRCLTKDSSSAITEIQIKCLERIVESEIGRGMTYRPGVKTYDFMTLSEFVHVFLADGGHSPSRKSLFGNNQQLSLKFKNLIFSLYTDLTDCEPGKTPNVRHILHDEFIGILGQEYNACFAMLSILYNFHKFSSKISIPQIFRDNKDHWANGFEDINEFFSLCDTCAEILISMKSAPDNSHQIIGELQTFGTYFTPEMESILKSYTPAQIREIIDKCKGFFETILGEKRSNPFMGHVVKPYAGTFGIDLANDTLKFCMQNGTTCYWLIGDSCNTYPPGHSVEVGMTDSIALVNIVFKDLALPFIPPVNVRYNRPYFDEKGFRDCEKIKGYFFSGGYPISTATAAANSELIPYTDMKRKIIKFYNPNPKNSIEEYNQYQFVNFLNTLLNIECNESFGMSGGKRTKNKRKRRKTLTKNKFR